MSPDGRLVHPVPMVPLPAYHRQSISYSRCEVSFQGRKANAPQSLPNSLSALLFLHQSSIFLEEMEFNAQCTVHNAQFRSTANFGGNHALSSLPNA